MKYRILIVEDNIMLAGQQKKRFDYYQCRTCGRKIGDGHKGYLAPTEAAISIIYILK